MKPTALGRVQRSPAVEDDVPLGATVEALCSMGFDMERVTRAARVGGVVSGVFLFRWKAMEEKDKT